LSSLSENCQLISDVGVAKAGKSISDLFILGILAGAYIGLAGAASTSAAFSLLSCPETIGLGRFLAGIIFPCALVLIVFTGAELFTGNTMMLLPLARRLITFFSLLRNWGIVYIANFIGTVSLAFLIYHSSQLSTGNDLLGGVAISMAAKKCHLSFSEAFILGIFCNWLVCLAIWMAIVIKDTAGKMIALFLPIFIFVAAGFEHSIANMYFISVGLFAAQCPELMQAASAITSPEVLASLTWKNFLVANLLPVTLGNIIGGGVCVALVYGYINREKKRV
jgi:formate/nitrite transporter